MNNDDSLSKLSKLSKLTKYLLEVDSDIWEAFKLVSLSQNLKIKEAMKIAITDFIEKYKPSQINLEIKIIENKEAKEDILQIIYEEEIRDILRELIEAKQRKANMTYMNEQRKRLFELLRKNPIVSKDLADEVRITLKNLKT